MTMDPSYLAIARRDIGQRETSGPNDSPFIRALLKRLGLLWLLGQPWCGMIMADWLTRAGYPVPEKAFRALAWASYGDAMPGPRHGAIAVLSRKGGGHVAIVTGITANGSHVRLLGGNQGDAVSEAWFSSARVTAYRAPHGVFLQRATVAPLGALSTSEA